MEDESGSAGQDKFFVLVYDHKHGEDLSLHGTPAACCKTAVQIMLEWIGDLPSLREQRDLLNLIKAEKYQSAMVFWGERMSEYFRVEGPMSVQDPDHPDLTDVERRIEREEAEADDAG